MNKNFGIMVRPLMGNNYGKFFKDFYLTRNLDIRKQSVRSLDRGLCRDFIR